jgi:broad specificity phosphatase PhoE
MPCGELDFLHILHGRPAHLPHVFGLPAATRAAPSTAGFPHRLPQRGKQLSLDPSLSPRALRMLLLLVRHAESENNALLDRLRTEHGGHDDGDDEAMKEQYSLLKSTDPGLSELGTEQAMRCSEWIPSYLRSMDFLPAGYRTELVSSPMERALRTAEALAVQQSTQVEIWSDVHETKGCWKGGQAAPSSGRGASEILAAVGTEHFRNSAAAPVPGSGWWTDAASGAAREKETDAESCERALRVAARLRAQALAVEEPTVKILVTHGNWMSLLVQALLLPQGTALNVSAVRHDNTAVSAIVLPGAAESPCTLVQLNRSEHLDAEPAIRRTRQQIALSGFGEDGRRPSGWAAPAAASDVAGKQQQGTKERRGKERSSAGWSADSLQEAFDESPALLAGIVGSVVVAGGLAVLAAARAGTRSTCVLEQALKL